MLSKRTYLERKIVKRTLAETAHILETGSSLRETAIHFGTSKSTVHKDVSMRLKFIDKDLYEKVKVKLEEHIETRHIKGGNATKEKWEKQRVKVAN